jgi:hypothetical protein
LVRKCTAPEISSIARGATSMATSIGPAERAFLAAL